MTTINDSIQLTSCSYINKETQKNPLKKNESMTNEEISTDIEDLHNYIYYCVSCRHLKEKD